jgi:hypothetical protein
VGVKTYETKGFSGQLLRNTTGSYDFIGQSRWARVLDERQAEYRAFDLRDDLQHRAGGEIFFRKLVFRGAEYHQIRCELLGIISNHFAR